MKKFSWMTLLLCAIAPALAQTADEILTKNAQAMGGAKSVADLKSYTSHGIMTAMNGMTIELETYNKGDKMLVKSTIKAMNTVMTMGCNAGDCWAEDPYMGLRALSGQEKEQQLISYDWTSAFEWKEQFPKREFKGTDKLNGKDVYKVLLVSKAGMSMLHYIDQKTYMVLRSDFTVKGAMGEMSGEIHYDEYKDIYKGFKIPVKSRTKTMGMEATLVVDKYEMNVEIPDSKFKKPEGL